MSWDYAGWVAEPVDVAALLPVPSRWRRYDHEDFTCWEFNGERWLIHVCDWEPIDDLAEVPDRVRQLLPGVGYLISIGMEPINPSRAAWGNATFVGAIQLPRRTATSHHRRMSCRTLWARQRFDA